MEINLPDGSVKELENGSNGLDLAKSIGAGLAKSAVAVVVNGEQRDLLDELPDNSSVSIITIQSDEGLEIMRHTLTAQVLAKAIKNLYSDSRLAIGPTIENGFYYDVSTKTPISVEDLPKIENEMKRILENKSNIVKSLHSEKDAKKMFKQKGESLKVEIIDDADQTDNFQIYTNADEDFIDLCRGPHLVSSSKIGKAFKLTKVSGAYWRGDSKNEMLQRIYGTSWASQKDLDDYLKRIEEAEKRSLDAKQINPERVSEDHIANVVSKWSGIPVEKLLGNEKSQLMEMEALLSQSVIGQREAVECVSKAIRRAKAGLSDLKRPLASFLFLGPTGVGKTELSKTLSEFLFQDKEAMTRIDMSEYMEKHSISRLIGSPPGYVGFEEGGALTEAVRRKPYQVILFDEVEKAHNDVLNLLLQVLDEGNLTDAHGRNISFSNAIIILTSNLGSEEFNKT